MPTTISYPNHVVRQASNRVLAFRHFADSRDAALLTGWAVLMLVISATLSVPEAIEACPSLLLHAF